LCPGFSQYELIELFSGEVITALEALFHEDRGEAILDGYLYVHLKYAIFRFKDCTQEFENPSRMNCLRMEVLYYPYFDIILSFGFNNKPHLFAFVHANSLE